MSSVRCPHCDAQTPLPETGGTIVDCAACDRSFSLPSHSEASAQPALPEAFTPTEVPLLRCGAIAVVATAVFYAAVVTPLSGSYFGQLFADRGWVPYCIALLAAWSIAILITKVLRVREQAAAFAVDLLPDEIDTQIDPENAQLFRNHAANVTRGKPASFLSRRVDGALLHLASQRGAGAVSEHLARHSDADANAVDTSYSTLRVFVWAIPILGFIGTVLGIGTAVAAFSDTVSAAVDIDLMKQSIGSVATGLGVAFDTTLLALVTSILLMFPMSWLQKREEEIVARVDEYCDVRLARRIADGGNAADVATLGGSVGESLRELDAELRTLSKNVGALSAELARRAKD